MHHPNCECNDIVLPFFPKYEYEYLFESNLRVTWFESDFSQSRFNFEKTNTGSNACTLIAVLLAARCYINKIQMHGPEKHINYFLVKALGESILEGNSIHNTLKAKGILHNINLTVPDGIKFSQMKYWGLTEWTCNLYMQRLEATLYPNMKNQWLEWTKSSIGKKYRDLFVILICDARSVLFVINDDLDTVTLIDSHQHTSERGAVIAMVARPRLKCLCQWFGRLIDTCYHSSPELYELSFLYFKKRAKLKRMLT
ncbi:hypothetical protein Trydic_g6809 [Trypoxylus dichotomus]